MKLTNLILTAGLTVLAACNDVRIEYSKPVRTEVSITQEYVPARSTIEPGVCYDYMSGGIRPGICAVDHPAKYLTIITSRECTQEIDSHRIYNQLQLDRPQTLEYLDIYRNTYGQMPNSAEKETILLETKKVGCKFLLLAMEEK